MSDPASVDLDLLRARRILKLVLGIGSVLLASGARTTDVEQTMEAMSSALGAPGVEAGVTFSSISASVIVGADVEPLTVVRMVRDRSSDYTRLAAATSLARSVREQRMGLDEASSELERIATLPAPYPRTLLFFASALSAAASTVLFGGAWLDAAATLGIGLAVEPVVGRLNRSAMPPFFRLTLATALATILAVALVGVGVPINGGLVVTGGLLRFLPGGALVAGMRDLIEESIVSGTARLAEAVLLGAGVAAGATLALTAGTSLGVALSISSSGTRVWMIGVQVVAAAMACGLFGIRLGLPRFALWTTAGLGALGWLVRSGVLWSGDGVLATTVAAAVVGLVGGYLARRAKAPTAIWVVPASLPLVPGLLLVQALLATGGTGGQALLARAVFTAFMLGAGVAGGDIAAQMFRRFDQRVVQPMVRPAAGMLRSGVDIIMGPRAHEPTAESTGRDAEADASEEDA